MFSASLTSLVRAGFQLVFLCEFIPLLELKKNGWSYFFLFVMSSVTQLSRQQLQMHVSPFLLTFLIHLVLTKVLRFTGKSVPFAEVTK